jgi:hypothetical protein
VATLTTFTVIGGLMFYGECVTFSSSFFLARCGMILCRSDCLTI